jgi:hypothetical protein
MTEIIDLDKLLPEPRMVRICGKEVTLYPGKLKALIKLQKTFSSFKNADQSGQSELLDTLIDTLEPIIPDIKRDDIDLTIDQIPAVVTLAYENSVPKEEETPLSNENKMTVASGDEKKTEVTSQGQ